MHSKDNNLVIKEKNIEQIDKKQEYHYPDIGLIKDENIKNALNNIPESGILNVPIGLDENNEMLYFDITMMPNLLIGGTVMSGKTNMINSIILSLISKYSIDDVRLIIADSKGVDYSCYNVIPHLFSPIIKEMNLLQLILQKEVYEMKRRYSLLNSFDLKKYQIIIKLMVILNYHII